MRFPHLYLNYHILFYQFFYLNYRLYRLNHCLNKNDKNFENV